MKKKELIKKIAQLETFNDQLLAELEYLDILAKQIGFEEGLSSLKSAAQEILNEQQINEDDQDDPMAM